MIIKDPCMFRASLFRLLIAYFPRAAFSTSNRLSYHFFSVLLNGYYSVKDVIIEQKQQGEKRKMNFPLGKLWFFGSFLKAFQVLRYLSNSEKKPGLVKLAFVQC